LIGARQGLGEGGREGGVNRAEEREGGREGREGREEGWEGREGGTGIYLPVIAQELLHSEIINAAFADVACGREGGRQGGKCDFKREGMGGREEGKEGGRTYPRA